MAGSPACTWPAAEDLSCFCDKQSQCQVTYMSQESCSGSRSSSCLGPWAGRRGLSPTTAANCKPQVLLPVPTTTASCSRAISQLHGMSCPSPSLNAGARQDLCLHLPLHQALLRGTGRSPGQSLRVLQLMVKTQEPETGRRAQTWLLSVVPNDAKRHSPPTDFGS